MTELTIETNLQTAAETNDGTTTHTIAEALRVAGTLIIHPRQAFATLRERPYWVVVFALLSMASVSLGILMMPYNVRAALAGLPSDMPVEQQQEIVAKWHRAQRTGMMMMPALLLMKLAFGALVIWLLSIGAGKTEKFKRAMSLITHAGVIVTLEAWFVFATLAWRGLDAIRTPFDLQPEIGLNALIATTSVPMTALLGGINPFELWFVVVLAMGLAKMFELRKVWATTISVSYWGFTLALQVGIAAIAALVAKGH